MGHSAIIWFRLACLLLLSTQILPTEATAASIYGATGSGAVPYNCTLYQNYVLQCSADIQGLGYTAILPSVKTLQNWQAADWDAYLPYFSETYLTQTAMESYVNDYVTTAIAAAQAADDSSTDSLSIGDTIDEAAAQKAFAFGFFAVLSVWIIGFAAGSVRRLLFIMSR